MKGKKILALAVAGALVVCNGCASPDGEQDTASETEVETLGTAVEVVEAASGEMRAEYALTGKVGASSEVQVIPMLAGQVQTLNVEEGDTVSSGQTLFTVDTSSVTSTLASLQKSYNSTKTATDEGIKNAEVAVKNAQSNVQQAQRAVDQALLGVESAKRAVESAQSGLSQANRAVTQAKNGVEQAKRVVEQAQSGVDQAQNGVEQAVRGVEQAQRGVESAQSAVANAQIGVDQAQEASDNAHALYAVGAVAEQDVTKADQGLAQAKSALENAKRGVADAEAGVVTAEAAVENAEAAVINAQNAKADAEAGVTSAEIAYANAQAAVANAKNSVADAQAGVTNANRSVTEARAGVESAQRGVQSAQATAAQARAQQTASLAQIQSSIDQINTQANLGRVTAPCSGIVTAVNIKRGGMASSAQPSVVIAENGDVEIQVSVAEDVFTNIKAGDEAGVFISSLSDEELTGSVGTLPVTANAQTNLYDVKVLLSGSAEKPQIGAFATVTFYTDKRSDTIAVPTETILTGDNDERYVFTTDGSTATRVVVETGLVNNTDTEIVSGLSNGDLVVVKGQSYLSDGAAVHIVESETEDVNSEDTEGGLEDGTLDSPEDGGLDDGYENGYEDGYFDDGFSGGAHGSGENGNTEDYTPEDAPFRIGTPKDALLKSEVF